MKTSKFQHSFLPGLAELLHFVRKQQLSAFLVGGAVRDLLLQRPVKDIDLLIFQNAQKIGRKFCRTYAVPGFPLHADFSVFRVVPQKGFALDFATVQGDNLEADLCRRDLTINAIAVPLEQVAQLQQGNITDIRLIDPTGGYADLQDRTIRLISALAVDNDPLRMIRVFRFRAQLGFDIEPGTLSVIAQKHHLLNSVAHERIYQELVILLSYPPVPALSEMTEVNVLAELFATLHCCYYKDHPQAVTDAVGLTETFLKAKKLFEIQSPPEAKLLFKHLNFILTGEIPRQTLFLLYMLLPATCTPAEIENIGRSLTLSKAAIRQLLNWQRTEQDPRLFKLTDWFPNERNRRSFLFKHQQHALLGIAAFYLRQNHKHAKHKLRLEQLWRTLIEDWKQSSPEQVYLDKKITGRLIMELAGINEGKKVGRLLKQVRKLIYIGEVTTLAEVEQIIPKLLQEPPLA